MDTTEGVHKPLGKYIFNWINCSVNDPIVKKAAEAGYKTLPNPSDEHNVLICMPVEWSNIEFDKKKVQRKDGTYETVEVNLESAITQLERYKMLQINYCEQNVSNTISYSVDEVDDIVDWLIANWDYYVGVSFLFRADPTLSAKDLGFEYLPQEVVTKERYKEYVETLRPINWENTDTSEELELDECSTGACPIK